MDRNQNRPVSDTAVSEILKTDRSLYSTQFSMGFRSLHFLPELEEPFLQHYLKNNPAQMKRVLPIALVLTLLFLLSDSIRLPTEVFHSLLLPRAVQFIALIGLAVVVYLDLRRLIEAAIALTLAVYGVTTPILLGTIGTAGIYAPIGAQLLILIFCYFLSGLRFFRAATLAAIITAAYPLSQLLFDSPLPHLGYNCYFLLIFNVVGLTGAYFLEYAARENYLGGRLLGEMALYDSLTGLLNRRAFSLDLDKTCRQASREGAGIAVAMVDVDHFKEYNDYFGHLQGDECLGQIADALAATIKRPLDKVGRYGGEEFILVWYDCDDESARELGELTRVAVEQLGIAQGPKSSQALVTISVGVASCKAGDKCSSSEMIRVADRELYRAKNNGRNRVELAEASNGGEVL